MPDEPPRASIEGQAFSEPYSVPGEIRIPGGALVHQPVFHLTEAEWTHIQYGPPKASWFTGTFLFLALGSGLTLMAKLSSNFYSWVWSPKSPEIQIYDWEWLMPCVALILAGVSWVFGLCLPNERKRIKNIINSFFRDARRHTVSNR